MKQTEKYLLTPEEEAEAGKEWFVKRHGGKSYNRFQAEALLNKALKCVGRWGNEDCFEHPYTSELPSEEFNRKRHRCPECWESLLKGEME